MKTESELIKEREEFQLPLPRPLGNGRYIRYRWRGTKLVVDTIGEREYNRRAGGGGGGVNNAT